MDSVGICFTILSTFDSPFGFVEVGKPGVSGKAVMDPGDVQLRCARERLLVKTGASDQHDLLVVGA